MLRILVVSSMVLALSACGKQGGSAPPASSFLPPAGFVGNADLGAPLYAQNCARCHGVDGNGTNSGPPMLHKYYEPNHHADIAFYRAISRGVAAHHWNFGDMPPVEGVSPEQAAHITAYIRGIQRAAGIF